MDGVSLVNLGSEYPKEFYQFGHGVKISDSRIQGWIKDAIVELSDTIVKREYPADAFINISSGDTLVVIWAYRYGTDVKRYSITINICKGRQELTSHDIFVG